MDWSCCHSQSGRRYGSFVFISPGAELISVLLSLFQTQPLPFFPINYQPIKLELQVEVEEEEEEAAYA
jgi:hypothetical protein